MSRGVIIKTAPSEDLYVEWSNIVELPTFIGNRQETFDYLRPQYELGLHVMDSPDARLARADATGTSAAGGYAWFGAWNCAGFIVEQRGVLPRAKLHDFALLYAAEDRRWLDLLEPFDDETAVRRD